MNRKILTALILTAFAFPVFAGNFEEGQTYYRAKRYDKARSCLEKAADEGNGNAFYLLGDIARIEGDFETAEKFFHKAVESPSTNTANKRNAYWSLISDAEQFGRFDKMVLLCREVWLNMNDKAAKQKIETIISKRQWSDCTEAVDAYNRGVVLLKQNRTDESAAAMNEAINLDSSFLAPEFELGLVAWRRGDLSEAEKRLRKVSAQIPYYAEGSLVLADVLFAEKKYSDSQTFCLQALTYGIFSADTVFHIKTRIGQCSYSSGDLETAEEYAQQSLKMRPSSIEALTLLSAVCIKKKDLDRALETLSRAEKIQPENLSVLYQKGSICYSRGDRTWVSCFRKIYSLTKGNAPYPKIFPLLIKDCYEEKKYSALNEIYSCMPESVYTPELALLNAKALYYRKMYSAAADELHKLSLRGDDRIFLAVVLVKDNRPDEAMTIVRSMYSNQEYREKALREETLKPLVNRITKEIEEKERLKKEQEEALKLRQAQAQQLKKEQEQQKEKQTGEIH